MSALALILNDKGYKVAGSDIEKYTFTQRGLEQAGIEIFPFDEKNIHDKMTIVAGNAFGDEQEEIKKARELGLKVMRYPEVVEMLIEETTSIGVAGAHGKTSTSGLLAHVLSGVSPTSYLVGDGSGKGIPDARFFVFEADEYRRHFVAYHPDYTIMTNIDFDHPDYFTGIEDVCDAFETLAKQTKKGLFVWGEDKYQEEIKKELLTFKGVKRRFTEKRVADMVIIDDYAHHPSEITATLDAARQQYPDKKIIAVFQPHTFSRTVALMDEFAKSLDLADKVYLTDIFSSIREHDGKVSAKDLGEKITKGGEVLALDNMSPLLDYHDDVVVFMGAGDIQKYEYAYEKLLSDLSLNNN